MRFSSADYKLYSESLKEKYNIQDPVTYSNAKKESDEEYGLVLMAVTQGQTSGCPVSFDSESKLSLRNLNSEMGNKFYDYDVVKRLGCKVEALFHPLSDKNGQLTISELARENITSLTRIGQDSAFGYALLGDTVQVNDLFVIKTPSQDSNGSDIYNERFVTEFGTNKMRGLGVPNYAMTYGHIVCSRPIIDTRNKRVVEFCSPDNTDRVPYLIYENIRNSKAGSEYVKTASPKQILSMYLQVLFATSKASKVCGLTHQDLHIDNVLMRYMEDHSGAFQIPIKDDNGQVIYLTADSVATIIDFGLSTIEYKGKVHGNLEVLPQSVGRTRGIVNPVADAYKLLMFMGLYCKEYKNEAGLRKIREIYKFFSDENIDQALTNQFELRYSMPPVNESVIDDLIRFVIRNCGGSALLSKEKNTSSRQLECRSCGVIGLTGQKNSLSIPDTLPEFMDVLPYIKRYYPAKYDRVIGAFNYPQARKKILDKTTSLRSEIDNLFGKLTPSINTSNLISYQSMTTVQERYYNLFQLINYLETVVTYTSVMEWSALTFKDTELESIAKSLVSTIKDYKARGCSIIQSTIQLSRMIESELSKSQSRVTIAKDPRLKWYDGNYKIVRILQGQSCSSTSLTPTRWTVSSYTKSEGSEDHRARRRKIMSKFNM